MKTQNLIVILMILISTIYLANKYNNKDNDNENSDESLLTSNYDDFYILDGTKRITGFDTKNRSDIYIDLDGFSSKKWLITSSGTTTSFPGDRPMLKLKSGVTDYEIEDEQGYTFNLSIQYVKNSHYKEAGLSSVHGDVYVLHKSSLPVVKKTRYHVNDFIDMDKYSSDDIEEGQKLLADAGIDTNDTSEAKIKKIAQHILRNVDHFRGTPSSEITAMSPMEQFNHAIEGKLDRSKGQGFWCENYAEMYYFFANIAGIKTRRVDMTGELDDMRISGHAFTESFIEERQQWAYVDLNNRKLFVKNKKGDFLSTSGIKQAISISSYSDLTATIFKNKNIIEVPYKTVVYLEEPYFGAQSKIRFYVNND